MIQAAILNGLDPRACVRAILARVADEPINRIDDLLRRGLGHLAHCRSRPTCDPSPSTHLCRASRRTLTVGRLLALALAPGKIARSPHPAPVRRRARRP